MNGTLQIIGIVTFAISVGLNVAGLTLDAVLYTQGVHTISEFARKNQWMACLIVLLNIVGLIGLLIHFTTFKWEGD